ncbi:unnamed protein product [Effrenium voratum]|uniref:Uncharacterized protein n=1 Tax=Effrenium voratum TaxID=2562239 RepID=A0AA36JQ32_9DINO|nr:unnamed protein product [Effrenium voratum]
MPCTWKYSAFNKARHCLNGCTSSAEILRLWTLKKKQGLYRLCGGSRGRASVSAWGVSAEVWSAFVSILPECAKQRDAGVYGLEPITSVMQVNRAPGPGPLEALPNFSLPAPLRGDLEYPRGTAKDTIALARRKVKELPGCDSLLEQIEQLPGSPEKQIEHRGVPTLEDVPMEELLAKDEKELPMPRNCPMELDEAFKIQTRLNATTIAQEEAKKADQEDARCFLKEEGLPFPQTGPEWRLVYRAMGKVLAARAFLTDTPAEVMQLPVQDVADSKEQMILRAVCDERISVPVESLQQFPEVYKALMDRIGGPGALAEVKAILQLVLDEPPEGLYNRWVKERLEYYRRVEPSAPLRDVSIVDQKDSEASISLSSDTDESVDTQSDKEFDITREDLESWYEWFYGDRSMGRTVTAAVLDKSTDSFAFQQIVGQVAELNAADSAPALFLWVVGRLQHVQGSLEELLEALRTTRQPVVGIAMGVPDAAAARLLSACDYVYSDGAESAESGAVVVANEVFQGQALHVACAATAELVELMTPDQLIALKSEMVQAKAKLTAALSKLPRRQDKQCIRSDSIGSNCSTDVPDDMEPQELETRRTRKVAFSKEVEVERSGSSHLLVSQSLLVSLNAGKQPNGHAAGGAQKSDRHDYGQFACGVGLVGLRDFLQMHNLGPRGPGRSRLKAMSRSGWTAGMEYYPGYSGLAAHPAQGAPGAQNAHAAAAQAATIGQPAEHLYSPLGSLVQDLQKGDQRETALLELSKQREKLQDLAPVLWHSFGSIVALIQEIVQIYPQMAQPPTLAANASNRACNSLALLQCVASHAETRPLFLKAQLPLLLYPFLNASSDDRPIEFLRLTSLGVIGALVKVDDPEVISFLLHTEIIPLCLRIMEQGSELSKTVATFIVQKLLLDEQGLSYVCSTAERFYAVTSVLSKMVDGLVKAPCIRLLKHVVRCYLRLIDSPRAREVLKQCLPEGLQSDPTLKRLPEPIQSCLEEDQTTKRWLVNLLTNLNYR